MQQQYIDPENFADPRITRDDRTLGVIAHALTFIEGGIIGPLVVYLIKRNDSPFVAFHALQSLYFGLLFMGATFVTLITCIGPFVCLVVYFIYEVIACVRASEGRWYKLPLVGTWAMNSHPIPPFIPGQYPQAPPPGTAAGQASGTPPAPPPGGPYRQ